ncbi:hypothetical protein [Mucilaginibacter sp. SJ]|uniref:hypothetical protein n=1 Tax=Mucilaginibacter sp. SJ TaxID=3029053 RepID=UPI0023A9DE12|nr:hypothetical protein [Mucilaginibacter sp. SJ]WEA00618.1 hypothetical protein MusilaSJ_24495 [Mucilaginibacter sp. SJ]
MKQQTICLVKSPGIKKELFSLARRRLLLSALLLVIGKSTYAAVWQWSVLVKNAKNNNGLSRAWLWIPPNCKMIKAVVFAQHNMEEQSILEDTGFRKKLGEMGIAEVWVSPAYDLMFHFNERAGETFDSIMNDLADVSGYDELRFAPVAPMGHSAAASAPYYMAAWNPGRILACISVSGQWPYFRGEPFAPDIWGTRNINYVPCLETMGEYEAAATWSTEGLRERQAHPALPLSMLSCPGEFHFAMSESKAIYIALYLKKALQYRLPKNYNGRQAPRLIPVDPEKTGWLADKWRFDLPPTADPAPVGQFKGDLREAFWYFDREIAEVTAAYESKYRQQNPQLIGYVQDGKILEQRNVHQQFDIKFAPEPDGITFKVRTAFYDTVPGGSPRPAVWANAPVGAHIGHAIEKDISVNRIAGPFIKINDSTFQIHPQMGYEQLPRGYELWFSASHPGDGSYKPAVQQGRMTVPPRNMAGKEQHITFAAIPDQHPGKKDIKLTATSDANVPVSFYIREGPAEIMNGCINLTAIPPKSKFPVRVTVIAWQYGNINEPALQTAPPVERTFMIIK